MTTDELERVLATALRAADDVPVDVQQGLTRLGHRQAERRVAARRWALVAVAASVLVVVLTSVVAFQGLHGDKRADISPAPEVTYSPSGLPVGLLEGTVVRDDGNVDVSTFRLRVLPDGTGGLRQGGATADTAENDLGYPVEIAAAGPGRAVLGYEGPVCADPKALTLDFTVRRDTVVIEKVTASGCLVNADLVADLPGTVLHVLPDSR